MAILDCNYCFTTVDIGAYGCASDSKIFKNSIFVRRLDQNLLHIPENRHLPGNINGRAMLYVFVGDEAFSLLN